jgi:hypothetical protein
MVLKPSSFAPFNTCNAQCEPSVDTLVNASTMHFYTIKNVTVLLVINEAA